MDQQSIQFSRFMDTINKNGHPDLRPEYSQRIGSAFIDFIIVFSFRFLIWVVFFLRSLNEFDANGKVLTGVFQSNWFICLYVLTGAFYYSKDAFNGRSVGKRVLKLQLIEKQSGMPASPVRSVFRNSLLVMFPLETILIISNLRKRTGDYLCGTLVVQSNTPARVKYHWINYVSGIFLSLVFSALFYLPVYFLTSPHKETKTESAQGAAQLKTTEIHAVNFIDYFKSKYPDRLESVLLTTREGEVFFIKGSFVLKKDLFITNELEQLINEVKRDFEEKLEGKRYFIEVSFVYTESDSPKIKKMKLRKPEYEIPD